MANIKIAQLTNQTAISDTDLVIVETATSTNKMTVGKLKELLFNNLHITGSQFSNGLEIITETNTGVNGDVGIFASNHNSPSIGTMYVVEKGTDKFLIADLFKASASSIVIHQVTSSNGLSLSATNAIGTVAVSGFTNKANAVFTVVKYQLGQMA